MPELGDLGCFVGGPGWAWFFGISDFGFLIEDESKGLPFLGFTFEFSDNTECFVRMCSLPSGSGTCAGFTV